MSVAAVNPGTQIARAASEIATKTDTTSKAMKVIISIAEVALGIIALVPGLGAVTSLGLLKNQLGTAKTVVSAAGVLERPNEWITDKDLRNGKSWQKTANRVALTAAQTMELVGFVDKITTGFFSQAAYTIGGVLPIFDIVKNSLFAISAAFGIWHASNGLKAADSALAEKEQKLVTFTNPELSSQYKGKKHTLEDQVKKFGSKEKFVEYRVAKYEQRISEIKSSQTKNWVTIAAEIGKIVMIVLGMSIALLSLFLPILTVPAAVLVMASLGLAANAIGLSKNLYEALAPKPLSKNEIAKKYSPVTS